MKSPHNASYFEAICNTIARFAPAERTREVVGAVEAEGNADSTKRNQLDQTAGEIDCSRESRAKLATRRETTGLDRMASGYGELLCSPVDTAH